MKTYVYLSGLILLLPVFEADGKTPKELIAYLANGPGHCPKIVAGANTWAAPKAMTAMSTAGNTQIAFEQAWLDRSIALSKVMDTPVTLTNDCRTGNVSTCLALASTVTFKGAWKVRGTEVDIEHLPLDYKGGTAFVDKSLYGFGNFSVIPVDFNTKLGATEYYGGVLLEAPAAATISVIDSNRVTYAPAILDPCRRLDNSANSKCKVLGIMNRVYSQGRGDANARCTPMPKPPDSDIDDHFVHLYQMTNATGAKLVPYVAYEDAAATAVLMGQLGGGGDPRPKCPVGLVYE